MPSANEAAAQPTDDLSAGLQLIDRSSRKTASKSVSSRDRKQLSSSFIDRRSPLFTPVITRFVSVALTFALLTVGGIYGYHSLTRADTSPSPKQRGSAEAAAVANLGEHEGVNADTSDGGTPAVTALRSLAEGIYPGAISGLFPGKSVPMALIANPKQQQLTLLVGLEGWMPATVTLATDETGAAEGPTFRANGLILKFNQESSSAAITGTVIDVVTGEAGTWKISG